MMSTRAPSAVEGVPVCFSSADAHGFRGQHPPVMEDSFEADRRDLFPLPLLGRREPFSKGSLSQKRRRCKVNRTVDQVNFVVQTLNEMYGSSAKVVHSSSPSAAQECAQHELFKQVQHSMEHVPMYSEREAVKELLHSTPSYSLEVETTVRPYNKDLVSLPVVGATPPCLDDLLDPVGRELLQDPIAAMMLTPQEWGEVVEKGLQVKPYMDVVLQHDSHQYHTFVHGLYQRGMLHFTSRPKDITTPFFVAKKDGRLRLVMDCRSINQKFRDPPH